MRFDWMQSFPSRSGDCSSPEELSAGHHKTGRLDYQRRAERRSRSPSPRLQAPRDVVLHPASPTMPRVGKPDDRRYLHAARQLVAVVNQRHRGLASATRALAGRRHGGQGCFFKPSPLDVFDSRSTPDPRDVSVYARCSADGGRHQPRGHQVAESSEIEDVLRERLNIYGLHDDQHGPASISGAALSTPQRSRTQLAG